MRVLCTIRTRDSCWVIGPSGVVNADWSSYLDEEFLSSTCVSDQRADVLMSLAEPVNPRGVLNVTGVGCLVEGSRDLSSDDDKYIIHTSWIKFLRLDSCGLHSSCSITSGHPVCVGLSSLGFSRKTEED